MSGDREQVKADQHALDESDCRNQLVTSICHFLRLVVMNFRARRIGKGKH